MECSEKVNSKVKKHQACITQQQIDNEELIPAGKVKQRWSLQCTIVKIYVKLR